MPELTLDLELLEEVATAAGDQPWHRHCFGHAGQDEPSSIVVHAGNFDWTAINDGDYIVATPAADHHNDQIVDHIVTFDPPTALALIERLRQAETERDEWQRVASEQTRLERDRAEAAEAERDRLRAALECETTP